MMKVANIDFLSWVAPSRICKYQKVKAFKSSGLSGELKEVDSSWKRFKRNNPEMDEVIV